MDDEKLTALAVDLVLAMMQSASTDKIGALDWWPRARTALETAADVASAWPHLVSKMAAKLQIDATQTGTAKAISSIGDELSSSKSFDRFRSLCRRDAVFVVAMAQAKRDEQKRARKGA